MFVTRSQQARWRRAGLALLAAAALTAIMAGCGLKAASQFIPPAEAGTVKPIPALDGVELTVGSKDFTEQLILGKIAVILLDVAGATVTDNTNIQGSNAARKALEGGSIDLYWEYTGTSWISYNTHTKPIKNQQRQWQVVHDEDIKENGVKWLPAADLNNTYALAVREEEAKNLDVQKLSDLEGLDTSDLTFCVESEFANRDDGFPGMLETYGMSLKQGGGKKVIPSGNVRNMETGVVYTATDKGTCNFGEVFTTDGRIKGLGLRVLEDDKQFFPNYNVAVTINEETYKQHPQLAQVFEGVTNELTNDEMAVLTSQVDMEGADPAIVARDWLKEKGFVT
ncbi:MAG: glycine/betaine ABC transporter substrate-binding protein [Streptosporangiales bacterium]|nr:glycine/betaine ABC transporter substrate-binding protein [Streptosporangiales bacterium]